MKKYRLDNIKNKYDSFGRITDYSGYKVTYISRGTIDDYLDKEWYKEDSLLTFEDLKGKHVYTGRGYKEIEMSDKRIMTMLGFENSLFIEDENISVFKVDLTPYVDIGLDHIDYRSVMRIFSEKLRWDTVMGEIIIGRAYSIECGDNDRIGMHLFVAVNADKYNGRERYSKYNFDRNMFTKWFIDILEIHGGIFKYCNINISECIPGGLMVINKNDIVSRNSLIDWFLYICKINAKTRGWLMDERVRLFETSRYEKVGS